MQLVVLFNEHWKELRIRTTFKHFSCSKFKLLSTAGYSFFSRIRRITL